VRSWRKQKSQPGILDPILPRLGGGRGRRVALFFGSTDARLSVMTMRSMVFQLGVHLEDVVAGEPRYFNFYVTESAHILKSAA
jgi:hypothetical protein